GTPTPNSVIDNELKSLYGLVLFLRQQPYCDINVWNEAIVKPIKENDPLGMKRLQELLQRIIVCHKKEDRDVQIPKCHTSIKYLTLKPHEKNRYNEIVV